MTASPSALGTAEAVPRLRRGERSSEALVAQRLARTRAATAGAFVKIEPAGGPTTWYQSVVPVISRR